MIIKEYITVNDYCKNTFGCKVYKIALSCSDTCPNRDGSKGTGGCIFCSSGGSGDFASKLSEPISAQIVNGIKLLDKKAKNCKYIAYFQSFTSTYGDINAISEKFYEAANHKDIVGVSIATRPDCLTEEVMLVLKDLSTKTNLWVELGLQTANDRTAQIINRCFDLSEYDTAILKLKEIKCHIITHIILGLPGETSADMLNTVRYVGAKTDGIKFHLLYVVKGTALEDEFKANRYQPLDEVEYYGILSKCIKLLPDNVVIHRLTGDGRKKDLTAPLWSADKKRVLANMNRYFAQNGIKRKSI